MKRLITIILLAIVLQVNGQTNWTNAVGAWQTKDSVGTKKFGFRMNTGVRYDFDDRYALRSGSNASGTWGINISGNAANATSWGGATFDAGLISSPQNVITVQDGSSSIGYSSIANLSTALGLGSAAYQPSSAFQSALGYTPYNPASYPVNSGGETLQSVTDRGNTITKSITSAEPDYLRLRNQQTNPFAFGIGVHSSGYAYLQGSIEGVSYNGSIAINPNGGNVGIGTTSPTAKLEVNGNVIASDATASNHLVTKGQMDAAIPSLANVMTTNTNQTISGAVVKSFQDGSNSNELTAYGLSLVDENNNSSIYNASVLTFTEDTILTSNLTKYGLNVGDTDAGKDTYYQSGYIINGGLQIELPTSAGKVAITDETVNLSGNQTVAGVKTFSSSPIVPTPTTNMQAATKEYVDNAVASGGVALASGTYTPTYVTGNPAVVITPVSAHYIRVGNEVSVTGSFEIISNSPGGTGDASFTISLPVTVNNFTNANQLVGSIVLDDLSIATSTSLVALTSTKNATVYITIVDDVTFKYNFNLKYTIIN